jgi:cytochrome c oxidase subunit 4
MSQQVISPPHQGAAAHDESHGASDRVYVMVALFLAVMTALEVACSYTESSLGPFYVWVLLVVMAIKFFTVALFFMHLRYDPRMCKIVFFFGLTVATVIYIGALSTFHYWAPGFR